jgi:hypothetical protein
MSYFPIDYREPKMVCTKCGAELEGNPYDYELTSHEFLCNDCVEELEEQRKLKKYAEDW